MEDNTIDKLKSMLNGSNIPNDLQNILSNMTSSNSTPNSTISSESINNLVAMFQKKDTVKNDSTSSSSNTSSIKNETFDNINNKNSQDSSNPNIDFETIMKLKSVMDKMNSKDDPRSKLLMSLKPYLRESRKNKLDQYIQFLSISKIIDAFSKTNGENNL